MFTVIRFSYRIGWYSSFVIFSIVWFTFKTAITDRTLGNKMAQVNKNPQSSESRVLYFCTYVIIRLWFGRERSQSKVRMTLLDKQRENQQISAGNKES